MKPPASTPSACALRYAVKARLATDSEVPKALVSATTEKLLMPLPDRLISAKKPVRPRIVGVKIEVIPPAGPAAERARCRGATSLSTLRAIASGTATTSANPSSTKPIPSSAFSSGNSGGSTRCWKWLTKWAAETRPIARYSAPLSLPPRYAATASAMLTPKSSEYGRQDRDARGLGNRWNGKAGLSDRLGHAAVAPNGLREVAR